MLLPAVLVAALLLANYLRPIPIPVATLHVALPSAEAALPIPWPTGGQSAAIGDGYGLLGASGDAKPLATASIAKVIVALCVLQKQPLNIGDSGPTYTIGASDVASYTSYAAQGGSLVPVTLGEQLTEYQMLQALMLPSANNIADSLVAWVFGSQDAYATYATNYLQQQGLNQTHIGPDASGLDPGTTSTASDLANMGLLALKSPALMQIAGQKTATLPVVGEVANYDTVLGQNGITGLKTGNNDADPGAFLFTATARIGDKTIPLAGAVMGAQDLDTALQHSVQLVGSLQQGFEQVTVAPTGKVVGSLQAVWGAKASIVTNGVVQVVRWKATPLTETHTLDAAVRNGVVGGLKVTAGQAQSQVRLQLDRPLAGPSFWWRLTRH